MAVKIVDKDRIADDKKVSSCSIFLVNIKGMLDREVDILRKIQHKNIISVIGVYETKQYLYLVMELYVFHFPHKITLRRATGGELFDEIVKRGKYTEEDAARVIKQVASAISYLHDKGIVHRDLKVAKSYHLTS